MALKVSVIWLILGCVNRARPAWWAIIGVDVGPSWQCVRMTSGVLMFPSTLLTVLCADVLSSICCRLLSLCVQCPTKHRQTPVQYMSIQPALAYILSPFINVTRQPPPWEGTHTILGKYWNVHPDLLSTHTRKTTLIKAFLPSLPHAKYNATMYTHI